ncbi:hypothetical protein [uncultured Psychroserpens sp.]|uniref:hypothetical protein n=1 Tax=uncultured Psychroserpens sp. TaxID=255436 RepID=UPI0026115983|nr:hypothetical protein [uncultured Psychroserpens sp.]
MKHLFTILTLFITTISYSQTPILNGKVTTNDTVTDLSISVNVDSAKEIESTFIMKDIKELLEDIDSDESITFEITCNGKQMSNGQKSKMSYTVNGSRKDIDGFLKRVKKMRKAAIEYYNNK